MTDITIARETTVDGCLFTGKAVGVGRYTVSTPVKTVPIAEVDSQVHLHDEARGVNEVHIETAEADLEAARTGTDTTLVTQLAEKLEHAQEEELTIVVPHLLEDGMLDRQNVETLVSILAQFSDILVTPLLTQVCRETDTDAATGSWFDRVLEIQEQFLSVIADGDISIPVMGTVPVVSAEEMTSLLEVYLRADIAAFCFDFLGRKPTAYARIANELTTLMEFLATRGLHRRTLLYAINAHRGKANNESEWSAADFLALGLGFDILGGYHIPHNYSTEVWEMIRNSNDVRLFDKQEYQYQYVDLDDLEAAFPETSGFSCQQFRHLATDADQIGRAQRLHAAEQMNLALADFRSAIESGTAQSVLARKDGVTNSVDQHFSVIRDHYDAGRSQSGLGEF